MSDTCMTHIENHWKTLTISSNESFNKGDFKMALLGYKDALYRAEILNNYQDDCFRLNIPFIQVYVISCNNLSNTSCELDDSEEAESMLKRVVHYLLHLSRQENMDRDEIQSELKRASLSLLSFAEKYGCKKKQEKLLDTLKEQLVENRLIEPNSR